MSSSTLGILSSLIDPSFGIPTDVTFQIMSFSKNDEPEGEEQERTLLGKVKVHKLVLGLFSPVFKTEFFGTFQETKNVILVRETTVDD